MYINLQSWGGLFFVNPLSCRGRWDHLLKPHLGTAADLTWAALDLLPMEAKTIAKRHHNQNTLGTGPLETGVGRCGLRPSVPHPHTGSFLGEKKNSPGKDKKGNSFQSTAPHSSYAAGAGLLQWLSAWMNIEDQLWATKSDVKVDRVCSQRV